jgi:hypothetical protein
MYVQLFFKDVPIHILVFEKNMVSNKPIFAKEHPVQHGLTVTYM